MRPDRRLLERARAVRVALGIDAGLGLLGAMLVLAQATLLAAVIARAWGGSSLSSLTGLLVGLVAVVCARAGLAWGFEVVGRRAAASVLSELRMALVGQRLRRTPAALDGVQSGEVAAAAVGGIEALEAYFAKYLPQLVLAVTVPIAVVAWSAPIDLTSALIMVATLPLVPVFMVLVGWHTERRTRERYGAMVRLSTHFLDVVRGLPTLRAFNRGEAQVARIAEVSDDYRRATMGTLRITFLSGAVLDLAATLGVALIAVTVGVRLVDGGLGLEAGLTVLILAPELYAPLRGLGSQYHASADGMAVAGRILDLLDEEDAAPRAGAAMPSLREVPVVFEDVSFAYPSRDVPVLSGFSLTLSPGERVALVGPSGAGKSTVASLLLRFAAPASGRVLAGGVDAADVEEEEWRSALAWVPQRPTVLRGTVASNIALGGPDVVGAARDAGADAFIRALPDGYETVVGEGGRALSAGQTQRLALARALARQAPLLILDEPTANLDPESAAVVADAIRQLPRDRTVLLIAHDRELARGMDRIVELDVAVAAAIAVNSTSSAR
ncbi:MAG: thiol reductant ABC exporter subunit CydD [Solirubrobacteraceae bacterium]|nr:thiol reductant ABC exporter subunit CydD [Solirubrobacteraceae bacterium]